MVVDPSSKLHKIRPRVTFLLSGLALALVAAQSGPATAAPDPLRGAARQQLSHLATGATPSGVRALDEGDDGGHEAGDDPMEVADRAEQYAMERSAPAGSVSAAALLAARQQADRLPIAPAIAREVTTQTLDAEPAGYTDPTWSNAGAGFRDVSGRVTALATDGHTYYTGTADGGVWKSNDAGRHWYSIWDQADTLSIGALLVGPHHTLWVGTGEANTSSDSYRGTGVYRSDNGGRSFQRVGGDQLVDRMVFRLVDDGVGHVYAATSQGLYRHSSGTTAGPWTLVLKPDPNPDNTPYRTSFISDVVVKPGTHGQTVLAVLGWRSGSPYNGFYLSTTGGGAGSFAAVTPTGAIDTTDIGRTTLAYAADGSRLYAIVESPKLLATPGAATNLQGVFVSASGNPTGPYTKIADSDSLGASGSALQSQPGYHVGVQSWYNQALVVDPKDPMHAFVSLEEVFQTTDGGKTFTTANPYWNYGLACGEACPPATHPDQHALALTSDRKVVIGNDGGVYQRPASVVGYGSWEDLNATLHTLQYYDAKAGKLGGGLGYWGGLQDNGTSLLIPGAAKNIEPAGGDGGMVLVDPANANRSVGEYTNLALYSTTDGGHTFTTISPECGWLWTDKAHCDPSARFIAPFGADTGNTNHWVAVGNKVWDTTKGWDTRCQGATCDWVNVHDLGTDAAGGNNVGTAVATNGATTYVAFVDSGANPSPTFRSGIDTNYGGSWHRISSPVLPNRYITGLTVDPANPAHVYAIFNGYSRRWIPGGGTGVVFESTDGGAHWRDLSGNLPDAPGDALALSGNHLVLATDVGVFVASRWAPTRWARVLGMPHVVVDNVTTLPGRDAVVAATHGRGIWRLDLLF